MARRVASEGGAVVGLEGGENWGNTIVMPFIPKYCENKC